MATVNKDFKIKYGLIVEGTTATVNNYDILTKNPADDAHIIGLIGGSAVSTNTPDTVVLRDAAGSFAGEVITAEDHFAGDVTGDVTGTVSDISNHDTDDLSEGATNQYFTNQRALDATSAAYDAAGTAATEAGYVASDLTDHENATEAHGATGAVVGTTNTQTLTNKTIGDTLNFTGAGDMTINSDSHIVLTPAGGSSVKWGSDVLATQTYADTAAGAVGTDLTTHINDTSAHGVTGDVVGTTDTQTLSNKTLGTDLAAGTYKITGLSDPTADQDSATKKYVDDEIAALVDGAPALLNTLNELAAAIGEDPNNDYVGGLATSIGERVLKAGDSMSGNLDFGGTHKVTSLGTPTTSTDAATKGYVDGEISTLDTAAQGYATTAQGNAEDYADGLAVNYDAAGAAAQALSDAEDYADGLAVNYDAAGAASTAQTNAEQFATTAIDALDTDDIEEGTTNKYFTDNLAKDAAGYLLENSNQTNISITYDEIGHALTVTAESGLADGTTDDLDEGTTNLYFTDTRARGAVDGTTRSFTAINIDTYRKEEATQQYVSTASTVTAHTFTGNKSAKYLVRTVGMVSGTLHSQVSELLVTVDGSNNVAVTEYGTIHTSENPLSTATADYAAGEYRLRVTTTIANAEVIVAATTMTWED